MTAATPTPTPAPAPALAPPTPDGAAATVDATGSEPSLLDHLDAAAARGGTVHFVRDGEHVGWPALWRDAHRCAAWIAKELPGEHTLAGLLEPSRACLVALLGTWLAGRTFASLPHASRGMGRDEYAGQVRALVEVAGAGVVATPADAPSALDGATSGVRVLPFAAFGRGRSTATGGDKGRLVQFTSGTTDRPRGVVLGMGHIGANATAMARVVEASERDVYVSWLPLSHDMGLIGMCLAPLATFSPDLGGASHVWLSDPQRFVRDPSSWLRLADSTGGTVTAAPNFALELAARRLRSASSTLDLSALRCLIVGSDVVSAATLRRFTAAAHTHGLSGRALCPAYGLAEATLAVTILRPSSDWATLQATGGQTGDVPGGAPLVTLGPPVPGVRVRVGAGEDGEAGETGGMGTSAVPGRIHVSGPSVARDYLGRPGSLTPEGWLRTDDVGLLHDGQLYFVGRAEDALVVRGRNLDGGGLQRRLGSVPGVRAGCCAVVADDDAHGYAVVFEAGGSPDDATLQHLCHAVSDAAVRHAGVTPARVVVVGRGRLPKTPSGKLQTQRVKTRLTAGDLAPVLEVRPRRHDGGQS